MSSTNGITIYSKETVTATDMRKCYAKVQDLLQTVGHAFVLKNNELNAVIISPEIFGKEGLSIKEDLTVTATDMRRNYKSVQEKVQEHGIAYVLKNNSPNAIVLSPERYSQWNAKRKTRGRKKKES